MLCLRGPRLWPSTPAQSSAMACPLCAVSYWGFRVQLLYNSSFQNFNPYKRCQAVERVVRWRERQSLGPAEQAFSFLLAGSTGYSGCALLKSTPDLILSGRAITPRGWVLGLRSTWQLSWSTWLLRYLSWLVMLPGITRSPVSSQGIFSWPSGRFILSSYATYVV